MYIISRDLNEDKNGKLSYKIGLARGDKGLYDKVKSYKICYAYRDELFVQYMFVCLEKDNSEKVRSVKDVPESVCHFYAVHELDRCGKLRCFSGPDLP